VDFPPARRVNSPSRRRPNALDPHPRGFDEAGRDGNKGRQIGRPASAETGWWSGRSPPRAGGHRFQLCGAGVPLPDRAVIQSKIIA
jgi:hypothetical protein